MCLDLQPYTTTQAQDRSDVMNVVGFSDALFGVIARFYGKDKGPGDGSVSGPRAGLAQLPCDKLQGFIIAGEDKKFVWADAQIDGDSVVVSSPTVKKPAAVRYAWSSRHPWANLFNKDGLPAVTFRTDAW